MKMSRLAAFAVLAAFAGLLHTPAKAAVVDFTATPTAHPDSIAAEKGAPSILSFGDVDVFGFWTRGSLTGIGGVNQSQQGRGVGLFARGDNNNENRGRPIDNSGSRGYLVLDLQTLWQPTEASFDFRILSDPTQGYTIWGYNGENGDLLANDTTSFLTARSGFQELVSSTETSLSFAPDIGAFNYLIFSTAAEARGPNTQFYLTGLEGNELTDLPEPGILSLFVAGLMALGFGRYRLARRTA